MWRLSSGAACAVGIPTCRAFVHDLKSPFSRCQTIQSLKSWLHLQPFPQSFAYKDSFWDVYSSPSLKCLLVPPISCAVPQSSSSRGHQQPHTSTQHNASVFSLQDALLSARMSTGQMGCRAFSGQNKMAFECVEDPHQVREEVTGILSITFNAGYCSLRWSSPCSFHLSAGICFISRPNRELQRTLRCFTCCINIGRHLCLKEEGRKSFVNAVHCF